MELSLEAYRNIVKNVQSRNDLANLCRVSRSFRRVAERALYNTLYMREVEMTRKLCDALVGQPRVASWVEALTIAVEEGDRDGGQQGDDENEGEEDEEEGEYSGTEDEEEADVNYRMDLAAALALSRKSGTDTGTGDPDAPIASTSALPELKPQGSLWPVIAQALQNMTKLRHLNILLNGSPLSSYSYSGDGSLGWILTDCPFRLKSFHSDMKWNEDLVKFLNVQDKIEDLFIGDYDEGGEEGQGNFAERIEIEEVPREAEGEMTPRFRPPTVLEPTTISTSSHRPVYDTGSTTPTPGREPLTFFPPSRSRLSLRLSPSALPRLTALECTFSEAAVAIVPSRPVSRLKTCFSRTDPVGKREEMKVLVEALGRASATVITRSTTNITTHRLGGTSRSGKEIRVVGGWRALDIADAEYQEGFAMELLKAVVNVSLVDPRSRPGSNGSLSMKTTLRYLGTLVLPVGGKERLLFYGLLMQFRRLSCVELEVSAWNPSPATLGPVAYRALANELRLYCPGVSKVVFVAVGANGGNGKEGNGGSGSSSSSGFGIGERTTVEYVVGQGVGRVEREPLNGAGGSSEGLWRDL